MVHTLQSCVQRMGREESHCGREQLIFYELNELRLWKTKYIALIAPRDKSVKGNKSVVRRQNLL